MSQCQNPACERGQVEVDQQAYAELQWPYPENPTEQQIREVDAKRRNGRVAYRPCQDCRPQQFARWANGCLRSDHRATTCDLCIEAMGEDQARLHDRGAR